MKSAMPSHAVHSPLTIRFASVSELGLLNEIDLDSAVLFEQAGLQMDFSDEHEFAIAERQRWKAAVSAGTTLIAIDARDESIGFAAVGLIDGEPYLAQLSVRARCMRRGVGSALLEAVGTMISDAGGPVLWLTTYSHLPWNVPFYKRRGFELVHEGGWGPEMSRQLSLEQRWLPRPEERVVMRRVMAACAS
jgi:GNAT superfamily N-acetyltransferase